MSLAHIARLGLPALIPWNYLQSSLPLDISVDEVAKLKVAKDSKDSGIILLVMRLTKMETFKRHSDYERESKEEIGTKGGGGGGGAGRETTIYCLTSCDVSTSWYRNRIAVE